MRVPFFDMRAEVAGARAAIDQAIARVLDSGVFIGGPEVEAFERALAPVAGARRAVGTSSGSDALLAILMALGVGPGDEVVTTPLTFFATAGAPARLGARVVFADVDPDTLTLDPAAALAACTPRTRAIIPVHLFGRPAALPQTSVPIVEDAAQSLGAAPLAGVAAAYSFFPTKNLGALGDAGAVVTATDELADRVALLRGHGARPRHHHVALGGNFRLDAIQAAILAARLPDLPRATAARRAHAARYRALLTERASPVQLPPDDPRCIWHQFVIRAPRRDELRAHLAAAGIGTEIYYPVPLHRQPCFESLDLRDGALPVAERACAEVLALPIQPALSVDAQDHVVESIAAFYR
jgi:dTDP-4-amino-4,6-dideoxygalactose transaminase